MIQDRLDASLREYGVLFYDSNKVFWPQNNTSYLVIGAL